MILGKNVVLFHNGGQITAFILRHFNFGQNLKNKQTKNKNKTKKKQKQTNKQNKKQTNKQTNKQKTRTHFPTGIFQ